MRFHKAGQDGSGKCDALQTGDPDDFVVGALFEIADAEKAALDRAEGRGFGYLDKWVCVTDLQGQHFDALTYYATRIDAALKPYSWYLYHVVYGAEETGLPLTYRAALEGVEAIEDPDSDRDARERAIYL